MSEANCKALYEKRSVDREAVLTRARECARVTIPSLMPPAGHSSTSKLYTPYQSIGARGVNNLASKLLLSLFPPNAPFFRLQIDDFTLEELTKDKTARSKVEEKLQEIERAVKTRFETSLIRPPMYQLLKQLIVSGNVLLVLPKEGQAKVHTLENFVVVRDGDGNVLDIVIKETMSPAVLPTDILAMLPVERLEQLQDTDVEIYTRYYLDGKKIKTYQEVEGIRVSGSDASWPKEKAPVLALRWFSISGEDYGRSYVEEYLGDLLTLDGLSKAIYEAAAGAAKVIFGVKPSAITREQDIAQAENLDIITGDLENDVTTLKLDKTADMSIAYQAVQEINSRLAQAFLLNSSVTRQAERVTAEEIRFMIGELEDALGGVYALLSQELQLPLVRRMMDLMTREKKIPKLPDGVIEPSITTGLEALGRGHDLTRYQLFINQIVAPLGEQGFSRLNISDYFKRAGTALQLDMDGLIRTDEELQAEQQAAMQQQQQQMMMQGGMDMAKQAVGPAIKEAAANQE